MHCAGRGCAVVVVYLDDQRGAEAAVDEIVGTNGTAIAVRADITDELDVERLFSETIAAFGGVDVIVHADPGATGSSTSRRRANSDTAARSSMSVGPMPCRHS